MITLTILILTLLLVVGFIILMTSILGASAIVIFGDIIVCIVFIALLIKWIINRKSRR